MGLGSCMPREAWRLPSCQTSSVGHDGNYTLSNKQLTSLTLSSPSYLRASLFFFLFLCTFVLFFLSIFFFFCSIPRHCLLSILCHTVLTNVAWVTFRTW